MGQDAAPCRAVPRVPRDLPARPWGGLVPPSLLPPHRSGISSASVRSLDD